MRTARRPDSSPNGTRLAVLMPVDGGSSRVTKPRLAASAVVRLPGGRFQTLPIRSAQSPYSVTVQEPSAVVPGSSIRSGTAAPDGVRHVLEFACPMPRLWPSSCASTSARGSPLIHTRPSWTEASPSQRQSVQSGK